MHGVGVVVVVVVRESRRTTCGGPSDAISERVIVKSDGRGRIDLNMMSNRDAVAFRGGQQRPIGGGRRDADEGVFVSRGTIIARIFYIF